MKIFNIENREKLSRIVIGILIAVLVLCTTALIISCVSDSNNTNKENTTEVAEAFGNGRIYGDTVLTLNQTSFPVYCSNERIDSNLKAWSSISVPNPEIKDSIDARYGYIVVDTVNSVMHIYSLNLVLGSDTTYQVTKRVQLLKK